MKIRATTIYRYLLMVSLLFGVKCHLWQHYQDEFQIISQDYNRDLRVCYAQHCSKQYEFPVYYEQIPKSFVQFLIFQEDQRFFHHSGISPREIIASLRNAIFFNHPLRGASTITQQTARNLFLNQDRTLKRKWKEVQIAWLLEQQFSKNKILELYLSTSYWGYSQYGLRSAAKYYFKKEMDDLSVVDMAFLISMLPTPGGCMHWRQCSHQRIQIRMKRIIERFADKNISEKLDFIPKIN